MERREGLLASGVITRAPPSRPPGGALVVSLRRLPPLARWRPAPARWALAILCVGLPILEVATVFVFLPGSSPNLAPQASAVAPFGIFHDLRWLSVYASSWPTFGALAIGVLLARGAVTAVCVRLAWPAGAPPPRMTALLARGVGATVLAALFLVPSVALLFALAVVPVSWLFIAAVPLALAVALVVSPIAVTGGWWKHPIPLRAVGWVALSFASLTAAAAVVAIAPPWAAFVVAALSGAFNARAWVGMVSAVVEHRHSDRVVPAVPVALAVMVGVVAVGSVSGFSHATTDHNAGSLSSYVAPRPGAQAVLLVSGYGSHWNGAPTHPVPGPFFEQRFSYRGLGPSGRPLAYASTDTVQTLQSLDAELASQVDVLARATGRRIDIVAESEGALVAKSYLVSHQHAPVGTVVLASPLLAPGRVSYPVDGSTAASGLPSRDALGLLSRAYQSVAPIDLSPESPFLKSVDQLAPLLQSVLACPAPGVRQVAVLPLADATAAPVQSTLPFPSAVVPAFHGGLIGSPSSDRIIGAALAGQVPVTSPGLRDLERAIVLAASAWQDPTLVLSDYSRPPPQGQTLSATCKALAGALRS